MALTNSEKREIRETIRKGGSVNKAAKAFAKSRGFAFVAADGYYVRESSGKETTQFGWDASAGEYDSNAAWDLAVTARERRNRVAV